MTAAWVPLATTTLSSSASSITFGSISGSYRDLVLVMNMGSTISSGSTLTVNSDTTDANYARVGMQGNGSTTASYTNLPRDFGAARTNGTIILQFMDYSATDKHKTVLCRASNAANEVQANCIRWANTSAITSIEVSAGTYPTGSTFSLFGIAS